MKVLIIDNYDSFTYNLYQFIGEVLESSQRSGHVKDFEVIVKRNDQITLPAIRELAPDRIIISPGPGSPDDPAYFGVCAAVITELGPKTPLLGVCLGMQGIVHCYGGHIIKAPLPMHGKISPIEHDGTSVYLSLPNQLEVMRYHSLIAEANSLPDCLRITATAGDATVTDFASPMLFEQLGQVEIMGVQHKEYPIHGIQFHPESFATEGGKDLIRNFLFYCT